MHGDMIFDDDIRAFNAVSDRYPNPQVVPGSSFQGLRRCDGLETNTDTAHELFVFLHNMLLSVYYKFTFTKGILKER